MECMKSYKILLNADASPVQKRFAVELAGILGFESTALQFPIIEDMKGFNITKEFVCFAISTADCEAQIVKKEWGVEVFLPEDDSAIGFLCKELLTNFSEYVWTVPYAHQITDADEGYVASSDHTYPFEDFDKRQTKGMEALFERNFILQDTDNDLLNDVLNVKVELASVDYCQIVAAANIVARLGMETLGYTFPVLADKAYSGNTIRIEEGEQPQATIRQGEFKTLVIAGHGQELCKFSSHFCETLPNITKGHTWFDVVESFMDALKMKNIDGQFAYLMANKNAIDKDTVCYFSPNSDAAQKMKQLAPEAQLDCFKGLKTVYEEQYDIPWEVDVCKDIIKTKLLPLVHEGDQVDIQVALSEDKASRDELSNDIIHTIQNQNAKVGEIQVLCAYKQGFSWIDEVVIPNLQSQNNRISKLEIKFKPFLPEGTTQWSDENGATPQITAAREDTPDKWFDLPVRYLQELYPIDDILAQKLEICRDSVEFTCYDGTEDITYEFTALDSSGEVLYKDIYKAECSERKYIDEYPGVGLVHPSTGYIRAFINGEPVLQQRIATDLENIWEIYQEKILPYCKNYAMEKSEGNPIDSLQPFFSQMRLDIEVSEPDYNLSCRQDMISSINSLHEDLYFVGLDFFKIFGTRTTGSNLDAPGLILPVIKKTQGKPVFKFTLLDQHYVSPRIITKERIITDVFEKETPEVFVSKIGENSQGAEAEITVISPVPVGNIVREYASLLQKGLAECSGMLKGISKLVFKVCDSVGVAHFEANLGGTATQIQEPVNINDIDLMEDRIIGYEDYIAIINQLKKVDGLNIYRVAKSYQGRTIHAIELMPKYKGYISRTKLINRNPVEYINGRHHANEVSSTNAAFMLIRELMTNEKYKNITDYLNLVFVPFENADGAAIHYELQKDNPNWKLHIARFNSLGKEIACEYFNTDTIHTEANAFTKVWRKWLPDVITDNHGVPSHEWDQQFSGYTSPWFKGFWMPRALLYSYFFHIKDERYEGNLKLNQAMEDVVAESMRSDEEISSWNMDWQNRFEKYAHQWMPKLFPAEYYKDMISYWISSPYNANHKYAAVRYPWVTSVSFVSEVSDETAQGEYLNLCARAHALHDIRVIDMLVHTKCIYENKLETDSGELKKKFRRIRPVLNY